MSLHVTGLTKNAYRLEYILFKPDRLSSKNDVTLDKVNFSPDKHFFKKIDCSKIKKILIFWEMKLSSPKI